MHGLALSTFTFVMIMIVNGIIERKKNSDNTK